MDCPNCNSKLIQIDMVDSGFSSVFAGFGSSVLTEWVLWTVVAIIGISCLFAEFYMTALIFTCATAVGGYAFYKHHKLREATDAIYECTACKSRFIGQQCKPFTYAHGPYPK